MTRAMIAAALLATLLLPVQGRSQSAQPYAGYETRPINALSDQQIADLREGRGMGLALAAELNGYPGPSHVLELAAPLGLTPKQHSHIEELFKAMKAETIPLGERLIEQEAELERQFAHRAVTADSLGAITGAIGSTQVALRFAHLKYHLATVETLVPTQIARYSELRGYTKAGPASAHRGKGHH